MLKIGNLEVYGIIYKITNVINDKIYIGQSTQGFNKRYSYKGNDIERVYKHHEVAKCKKRRYNAHLLKSINKYGFESFDVVKVFDVAFSKEELDIKEDMYIRLYKSTNIEFGYNNMFGGAVGLHTKETKLKISKIQTEINGRKVYCTTTNELFDTLIEASRKYNITSGEIISCCKLELSKAGYCGEKPLQWLYYEDFLKGIIPKPLKKIICITTGKIFYPIEDACNYYIGVRPSGISQCCSLEYASHGELEDGTRLQWLYYEDYLKGIKPKEMIDTKVICTTTGKIFNSSKEGGEYYNIGYSHLYDNCKGKANYCGILPNGTKLQWLYYNDYLCGKKSKILKDDRIICLTTNKIFSNAGEARDFYDLDKSAILKCCKNLRNSCGVSKNGIPLMWMKYNEYLKIKEKDLKVAN